jgi:hypothetical protein
MVGRINMGDIDPPREVAVIDLKMVSAALGGMKLVLDILKDIMI